MLKKAEEIELLKLLLLEEEEQKKERERIGNIYGCNTPLGPQSVNQEQRFFDPK